MNTPICLFQKIMLAALIFSFSVLSHSVSAQTFVKKIGQDNVDEGANAIIASGDGNLLIAGYQGERAVIIKMSPSGSIIWQHDFKITATGKRDVIHDIELDGNFLMGCGYGDDLGSPFDDDAFVFRFDLSTQSLVWSRVDNSTVITRWFAITSFGGNWVLNGIYVPTPAATDGYIRVINSAGTFVSGAGYRTTNNPDDFRFAATDGTDMYYAGRVLVSSGGLCKSRAMATSIHPSSGVNWGYNYFATTSDDIRMYASDLDIEPEALILAGIGGTTANCNTNLYDAYVARLDLDGIVMQDNLITMPGRTRIVTREIKPNSDGYLMMGEVDNGSSRDIFLMQLRPDLQVQWVQTYVGNDDDGFYTNSDQQLHIDSDANYIVGRSLSYSTSGDWDMIVIKTDPNGNVAEDCSVLEEAESEVLSKIQTGISWNAASDVIATDIAAADEDTPTLPCEVVCGCISPLNGPVTPRPQGEPTDMEDDIEEAYDLSTLGQLDEPVGSGLSLYPNPAETVLVIDAKESELTGSQLTMTNVSGQVLRTEQLNSNRVEWNIEDLEAGAYLITITGEDGSSQQLQFVKQ